MTETVILSSHIASPARRSWRFWRSWSSRSTSKAETSGAASNSGNLPAPRQRGVAIRIDGVEQDFGAFPALRDVSLDIRPGELVALLGPSGSGKTTLLRVVAGLNAPDRGNVYFDQTDAAALPLQSRRVGILFQNYALFNA